jgi:hypothetical protein
VRRGGLLQRRILRGVQRRGALWTVVRRVLGDHARVQWNVVRVHGDIVRVVLPVRGRRVPAMHDRGGVRRNVQPVQRRDAVLSGPRHDVVVCRVLVEHGLQRRQDMQQRHVRHDVLGAGVGLHGGR